MLERDECFPICGDGLLTRYETCDDRNPDSGDGCDSNCSVEIFYECQFVEGTGSDCRGSTMERSGMGCSS